MRDADAGGAGEEAGGERSAKRVLLGTQVADREDIEGVCVGRLADDRLGGLVDHTRLLLVARRERIERRFLQDDEARGQL